MTTLENKIDGIDLRMVKIKLQDLEEGPGWSLEKTDLIEKEYKRFLYLCSLDCQAIPTKDIDTMWHQHILDTRAYAKDCQEVFGFFLHHFPYLGMRGEEDVLLLHTLFEKTTSIYNEKFKESYARCKSGCSSGRCSGAGCIGSCTSNLTLCT